MPVATRANLHAVENPSNSLWSALQARETKGVEEKTVVLDGFIGLKPAQQHVKNPLGVLLKMSKGHRI